jgi:cellulose synthase/poly-beta-1,6-N-acetylglucosamine synthase-like glycosyltransferase
MTTLLAGVYILVVAALSLYGLMGLLTLFLYWRHRDVRHPLPHVPPADLPAVTVQLPIYNERFVVERLLKAAVALDYPADRLQIQVVDDSSDDTTQRAAALVARYQQAGVNIQLVHRGDRRGYKAGALENALRSATGEFIAIFDADFLPPPDFLRRTIPHFRRQPRLGAIQTRWSHLNADESPLTAAQAIALDKHFAMEQAVRHRAELFPKFNGAAGVWRRACIEDAGGWEHDTVCEDLCLSTRAVLRRWRFRFLDDVEAPAELPRSIGAYKSQQARWAKGSFQCLLKFGRAIWGDGGHSRLARIYALLSMSAYFTQVFVMILLLLQLPLILLDYHFSGWMLLFSVAGVGQPLLFVLGQQVLYPDWRRRLRHMPTMLLVAIGIAPSNARALAQVLLKRSHPFVRTPKLGVNGNGRNGRFPAPAPSYTFPFDWIVLVELGLAAYAALTLILALARGNLGPLFLLLLGLFGFSYVAALSLREAWGT